MATDGTELEVPRFLDLGAGDETFDPTLVDDFLDQLSELIREAERLFLMLEAGKGSPDDIRVLFRVLHTIKGDSATLALKEFVELAHTTEGYLQAFRTAAKPLNEISANTLLEVIDALDILSGNLRERGKYLQGKINNPQFAPVALKPLIGKLLELTGK